MKTTRCNMTIAALLLSGALHAAESGTAIKGDDLKAEPFRDAKTVAALKAGDKVDILKKDGGWYEVKSAKGKGWVRMLSIRKGDARKGGGCWARVECRRICGDHPVRGPVLGKFDLVMIEQIIRDCF